MTIHTQKQQILLLLLIFPFLGCQEQPVSPFLQSEEEQLEKASTPSCYLPSAIIQGYEGENEILTLTFEMNTIEPQCAIDMLAQGFMFGDTTQDLYWNSFRDSVPWGADFANLPSGERAASSAYWTYQGQVIFDPLVSSITMYFDSCYNTRFSALNAFGFVIDQKTPPPTHACGETHGSWNLVSLSASGADIYKLYIDYVDSPSGYFYIDDMQVTRKAPPAMECDPNPVIRGSSVTCSIFVPVDSVHSWRFEGVTPDVTIQHVSPNPEWSGIAVHNGKVIAEVTMDGQPTTLSTTMSVQRRSTVEWAWGPSKWSFKADTIFEARNGWEYPIREAGYRVGTNCTKYDCSLRRVQPDLAVDSTSGYTLGQVSGGPNSGLWYTTSLSFRMDRASALNPYIRQDSDYRPTILDAKQAKSCRRKLGLPAADTLAVNYFTFNDQCKRVDMDVMLAGALAHEGFGTDGQGNGHEAQAQAEASDPSNDIYKHAEAQIGRTQTELIESVSTPVLDMQDRIRAAGLVEPTGNWEGKPWEWSDISKSYQRRDNALSFSISTVP